MTSPFSARKQIVSIGQQLYQAGMIAGTDGNLSVRLEANRILITPAGLSKGSLSPDDLVVVDDNGQKIQGSRSPSSEMGMHLEVYRSRPDIMACVHAHPVTTTAFAVAGVALAEDILPEVVVSVGPIPLIEYSPPGTRAVGAALAPHLTGANAFMLRNHGLLTLGRDLQEAFNRHETVEHFARIFMAARTLGPVNRIPREDYDRLVSMRHGLNPVRSADDS